MKNTTKTLRSNLFKQMEKLNIGEINLDEAKVIARMSSSIIHTLQADIENKKIEARLMKTICRPKKNIDGNTVSIPSIEL